MDIQAIRSQAERDIAGVSSCDALRRLQAKYLGRKGIVAELTGAIPALPAEERASVGWQANELKQLLTTLLADREKDLVPPPPYVAVGTDDIGMPGCVPEPGRLHPITQVIDEISTMFARMGFSVDEGPEIETEYNNFTGLNIPRDHPSRDAFDTFYLKSAGKDVCGSAGLRADGSENLRPRRPADPQTRRLLLRSHTSPMQVRIMKTRKPPLAVVVPGRVYRPDAVDASHSFMFHQIEGFLVDKGITCAHLKGVLESFARAVFGAQIKMRFRPHFFPFTEPSAEVDISCIICKGSGCPVCGRKGWLEILGCGMIHPEVFKRVGYDAARCSGFAFGMGVERIAMLKYGINDIRLFFENDLRFLRQF